jgi:hypothetical protein
MEELMKIFNLAIGGRYTVKPGMPWTQNRKDNLESDLQHRFQCMLKHGGMGKRDETKRRMNGHRPQTYLFNYTYSK